MSTKTLFFLSVSLIFLVGIAFGYNLRAAPARQKLIPQSEREQTFYDAWQQARLATISPTVDFRVAANSAAHDYVSGLVAAALAVSRGTDSTAVDSIIGARSKAIGSAFGPVLSAQDQATQAALWLNFATATVQYAQTPAAANPTEKAAAAKAMTTATEKLTAFYGGLSKRVPAPTIQSGLTKVSSFIRQSIDASANNSLVIAAAAEQSAAQTLGNLMDSLTAALVQQNATRF